MKPKEIQELIDFIAQSGLDEVNIETENFKLSVKKSLSSPKTGEISFPQPQQVPVSQPLQIYNPVPQVSESTTIKSAPASEEVKYITVKSPMIGTFYRTANPDSPAFVNVGDKISIGQPLCIIEAMKLFNEIESEISGKIVKVLAENATPVEYDQPLFLIDPS